MSDVMPVVLLGWRPLAKGSLRGFAKVRLGRALVIHDIPVLHSSGRAWVSMPAKPLVDRDGQPMRDSKGKQRYSPLLEWAERDASDRFSAAVVEAITREHGAAAFEVTA